MTDTFELECKGNMHPHRPAKEELTIQVNKYEGVVEIFTTYTADDGSDEVGLVHLTMAEFYRLKDWINSVN